MASEDKSAEDQGGVAAPPQPAKRATPQKRRRVRRLPGWNVVLLDDDQHTYEYVIEMLGDLFAHPVRAAIRMAREVDTSGRVIVFTAHRELAELKCEQIRKYGLDPRIGTCRGSMKATLEPAA